MPAKPRTRRAMIEYLAGHFRYNTMNSWNQSTSYAVCVKVHRLGLDRATENACCEMLDVEGCWDESGYNEFLHEFDRRHSHIWQIGTNGRSGGYLVLYQGGTKPSEYKSRCTECGQRNFQEATESSKRCGVCGEDTRVNYSPPAEAFCYPGRGTDMDEDFSDWSTDQIRDRVDLVWDFDQTCARAVKAFAAYAKSHKVEEREIRVPKRIKIAVKAA